jgi:hypothetical protein
MGVEVKGVSVGFSFFTLVLLLLAVIAHIPFLIGVSIDYIPSINFLIVTPLSIFVVSLNALIVFGLRRKLIWAYMIGSLEMFVLALAAFMDIWITSFSGLVSNLVWLLISTSMLSLLYKEYSEIKNQELPHV